MVVVVVFIMKGGCCCVRFSSGTSNTARADCRGDGILIPLDELVQEVGIVGMRFQ